MLLLRVDHLEDEVNAAHDAVSQSGLVLAHDRLRGGGTCSKAVRHGHDTQIHTTTTTTRATTNNNKQQQTTISMAGVLLLAAYPFL
jgi:hypothetical protein